MANTDFSVLLKAELDRAGIDTDLKKVQEIVKKYHLELTPDLQTASLKNQFKSVCKEMANDFNKAFNANVSGNDVFKVYENKARQLQQAIEKANKIQLSFDTGNYQSKVDSLVARTNQWVDANGNARISTESLQTALSNLGTAYNNLNSSGGNTVANQQALIEAEKALDAEVKRVQSSVTSMNATMAKSSAVDSLRQKIQQFYDINTASHGRWGNDLKNIMSQLANGAEVPIVKLKELEKQFITIQNSARQAGKLGLSFFDTIKQGMQKFSYWTSSTFLVMKAVTEIKDATSFAKEMDSALTNINYTMDVTKSQLTDIGNSSIQMAKDLKTSASNILGAVTLYANAKETADSILKKSEAAIMLGNVTGMSGQESAKALQSVMNQFELTQDDLMYISDTIQKVSQNMAYDFSSGIEEIVGGIERSGSVAKAAGLDLNEYASMLGLVIEKTGLSGETIGTAYRTILTRITKASKIEGTSDEDISKAETALKAVGVQVRSTAGEFRDMTDIMKDLGKVWNNLNDVQQANISYEIAGTRQTNIVKTLLGYWTDYEDLATKAGNAAGTTLENQSKYEETLDAKTKALSSTMQSFWHNLIGAEEANGVLAIFQKVATVLDTISSKLGSLGTVGLGAGIFAGIKNIGTFKTIISDINKVALAMDSLKNISQFNTGSTIANGMELSESAIISYQTAIDGLSLSQAQAALSSTALTDAQKEQILVSAGLLQSAQAITLEEVKQMASSASLSAQKKEEILTTLQGAYSENEWNMERLEAIAASGGESGAIAQSILAKKAENAENIKGVASSKALTASLWEQLKARLALLAANPVAWIAGVAAVSVGLIALQKKFTKSLDECTEELSNFNSEVENAQSEADSLQTEWETCQKRLGELQKLADNGTISIIEQEEYERLLKTNDELERNIRIQKEKSQLSAIDAANSADETLSKTVESKYVTVNAQDSQGVEVTQTAWITPKEELNASIEEYKRLQTEIDRLKVSYDKGNISAEEYNTQLTDLTNQQTDARNRASEMSDILVESEQAYTNLTNTGAELTTTQTANYNSVKQANDAYNDFLGTINGVDSAFENLDTTEKAQSLKNKYAAKKVSLPKGQGSYTVEDKEISDWIDTLSDEDLTVLASINFSGEQTKDSMQEALDYAKNNVNGNIDETDILSFSDAWEKLKNSTEDATKGLADDLIKLAEAGQLTSEALSEADTSEFFKNAGISAEEATRQINALVSASTQLQSMSAQISKMSDMLADKKNGTVASASDLAGFDATVKGLESWEEFEKVMMSSESTMEQCQKAANALATEWVNNGNFLANLTDETKQAYITQLDKMGVDNAEAIVEAVLTQKHNEEALALQYSTAATAYNSSEKGRNNQITTDLINVTGAEITQLLNEGKVSVDTANDLAAYVVQKKIASGTTLNTAADIKNLADLAGASTKLGKLLNNLAKIKQGFTNGMPSDAAAAQAESLQKQIEALVGGGSNKAVVDVPVEIKPTGSSGYTAPKTGSSGSGSDTKQTIDWIERLLDVLQKKIDQTKAKFENLFTLKDKKNNLTKQIQLTKNLLTATEKSADRYLKAANKVGLSNSLKKKVQNGSYDINDYSSEISEKIQKYENYYDKYKELKQQADELETDIRSLRTERYQLYVDDAESKIAKSQALAALDEGSYKKQNKHLEGQKKYYEESYAAQIKIAEEEKDAFKVTQLRAELAQKLRDIEKEEFDNVVSTYEYKIGHIKNQLDDITNAISDVENRGLIADASYYNAQESVHEEILGKLKSEKKELREQLKDIKKQTPAYYDAVEAIQSIDNQIQETNNTIENLKKSINDVSKILTNNILSAFKDLNSEADTLITLLGDNLTDDKLGALTNSGIAALGLYNQQLSVSKESANLIKNEINFIENAIKNGTYQKFTDANGMELRFDSIYEAEDRIKELYSDYRDEINSTYSYESKIVDLMRQKYQSELNYVKELIDQKKEALNAEKD